MVQEPMWEQREGVGMWSEGLIPAQEHPREPFNCDQQAVLNLLSGGYMQQGYAPKCSAFGIQPGVATGITQNLPDALRSSGLVTFPCNVALFVYTVMCDSLTAAPGGIWWFWHLSFIGSTNSMCLLLDNPGSHLPSALVLVQIMSLLVLVLITSQWSNCCGLDALWRTPWIALTKVYEASCPSNLRMCARADWISQVPPITK